MGTDLGLLIAGWVDAPGEELKRKVLGFLGRLAMHQQNSAELLYHAYNVDLATGD